MGQAQFCGKNYSTAAKYGSIYVQPDQPHYYAGEQVTGKIYLMLNSIYPGYNVNLKLKGKERTLVIWTEAHTERDPHDHTKTRTVHRERVATDQATCLFQTVNIYTFHGGQYLLPGQYEFPFSFKLPDNIPGTFHQTEHHLSASIAYTMEAFLEPADKHVPKLKYKNRFIVREPVREMVQSVNKATDTEVVCCCCKSYGHVGIKASFEKNTYCPSDEAHAIIQVDNSRCSKPMTDIKLELRQSITVKAQFRTEQRSHEIVSRSIPGVQAGQSTEPRQASILLPPAPDLKFIFLKGEEHLRNPNAFSQRTINSTTNGVLIKSHFFLEAKATPDACCANTPISSIPCHIVYPDYRFPVVQPPPNWQPQIMSAFNFSANLASQYTPQISINTNLGGMQGATMGINAGYPAPQVTVTTQQTGYPQGGVTVTTQQSGYPGDMGVNMQVGTGYPGDMGMNVKVDGGHQGDMGVKMQVGTGYPGDMGMNVKIDGGHQGDMGVKMQVGTGYPGDMGMNVKIDGGHAGYPNDMGMNMNVGFQGTQQQYPGGEVKINFQGGFNQA